MYPKTARSLPSALHADKTSRARDMEVAAKGERHDNCKGVFFCVVAAFPYQLRLNSPRAVVP